MGGGPEVVKFNEVRLLCKGWVPEDDYLGAIGRGSIKYHVAPARPPYPGQGIIRGEDLEKVVHVHLQITGQENLEGIGKRGGGTVPGIDYSACLRTNHALPFAVNPTWFTALGPSPSMPSSSVRPPHGPNLYRSSRRALDCSLSLIFLH